MPSGRGGQRTAAGLHRPAAPGPGLQSFGRLARRQGSRPRMRWDSAFRRTGVRRKRLRVLRQRLRNQIGVARLKIRPADEEVAAERNHCANLRAADIGERREALDRASILPDFH